MSHDWFSIQTLYSLISDYGYLAVLIGTFMEGETILVLGGLAAYEGYLELQWVILCAFAGALATDQLFFYLGRCRSQAFLLRFPRLQSRVFRMNRLLARYRTPLIVGFRFVYGTRMATPFVLGMSDIPWVRFLLLNMAGALGWATAIGWLGYLFGGALESLLGNIRRFEIAVAACIAAFGFFVWLFFFLRRRKQDRRSD